MYINNAIRHTRNPSLKDRVGVVVRVSGQRVYLETDSGYETWRLQKNLRDLTSQEQASRDTE